MEYRSDNTPGTMDTAEKLIKILIAEDNVLNQKIIEILIKRMGWNYTLVADGVEAVEECMNGDYDVILMDIDMPQMNGWEATIEIRRKKMNIPIIALPLTPRSRSGKKVLKPEWTTFYRNLTIRKKYTRLSESACMQYKSYYLTAANN